MRRLPPNFHTHEHGAVEPPPRWAFMPARTVLPFLRTPLGYDMAHPRTAFWNAFMLVVLPLVFWFLYVGLSRRQPPDNIGHVWLAGFAIASLVVSCVIFARRFIGQRRGEEIHTAEAGYSWLAWRTSLPVPLCELLIIPLGLGVAGWVIKDTFSLDLGWWLVVCAVSYLIMARWEYRRLLSQTRATVDDMIRAQTFEERLDGHERQARGARTGKAGPQQRPQPAAPSANTYGRGNEPDMAELGDYDEPPPQRGARPLRGEQPLQTEGPAAPPDVAGWRSGSDSVTPDYMAWFRRRRK
jgi:hypothetical protein